jgi:hypothetical protein
MIEQSPRQRGRNPNRLSFGQRVKQIARRYFALLPTTASSDAEGSGTRDGRKMICADAQRDGGRRFIIHAEDASVAFVEMEAQCEQ